MHTPVGKVARISTRMGLRDKLGGFRVRWGIGRMHYNVPAGLYAVGDPDADSPVLVTANYKLSFDLLRRELAGRNLWLLVLETFGINVWCAAGKRSFGTEELIHRVQKVSLGSLVKRWTLILPQRSHDIDAGRTGGCLETDTGGITPYIFNKRLEQKWFQL